MKIYLGADHNGFDLKTVLREHLVHNGYEVEDMGAHSKEPLDDYPQYAYAVASKVLGSEKDQGILICASGQGMAIAANRVSGIRAGIAWSEETAVHAKRDDDVNILVLASRYSGQDDCIAAVDAWLGTKFSENPKYERRIKQIDELYG